MSAIYQRARPIRWDQVVGQEHVKDVLKAALEGGRIGHAYLFSGPRGVGKTTTARLIAMTANCETPGVKPCGECESCLSVRAGSHPDVMEIDAASHNSVDDVRELREKVSLSAMRGGKKIYILDEAHMMSRAAFNALLKTLEEPPSHVIFILATTEPEKIIPTILSRCQHYRFRRLTAQEVAGKLSLLAAQEGVQAEPEALALIGRLADGAMRDGESLLERMLAAGESVTRAGVEAALGLPPGEQLHAMAGALVQLDAATLLAGAGALYRAGYAARTVVEGLVTALGEALHAELGLSDVAARRLEGADVPRLLRLQAALDGQDARFARGADQQSLELALTHALIAGEGSGAVLAPASGGAGVPAELNVRLARLEKELRDLKAGGAARPAAAAAARPPIQDEIPAFDTAARAPAPARAPVAVSPPASGSWADVVRLASSQTKAFLKPARMHAQQGYVSLSYDDKGGFHARQIIGKLGELEPLVVQVFGPVMLEILGPTPDSSRKMQLRGVASPGASVHDDRGVASPGASDHDERGVASPGASDHDERGVASPGASLPSRVGALVPDDSGRASAGAATLAPLPPDDIPPFAEARAGRASPPSPTPAPVQDVPADIPAFAPVVSAATATQRKTSAGRAAVAVSPDDRAPAPLPLQATATQIHPADVPPLPLGAGLPPATDHQEPPARTVYLAPEPIFQEPDWDDLGVHPDAAPQAAAPLLSAAPAGPTSQRAAAAEPPMSAASRPALADLRAHPLYQEAAKLWPGRVREVGKVKPKAPEDAQAAEVVAEEELAEGHST